jgi:regulation of enolase protein 1 (concanavalin A-like superfamily)
VTLESLLRTGEWTTPPVAAALTEGVLRVTAAPESDAWRHTAYGFVHDSEHALLEPFGPEGSVEVSFRLDYAEQFDQAGVFIAASETEWIKAGVEISDGLPQAGAVVTHGFSDWSVAPVPEWAGRIITVRASRAGDGITIRIRADDEPFRLLRLAHFSPDAELRIGLFCCAPMRDDLTVEFTRYERGEKDAALHE